VLWCPTLEKGLRVPVSSDTAAFQKRGAKLTGRSWPQSALASSPRWPSHGPPSRHCRRQRSRCHQHARCPCHNQFRERQYRLPCTGQQQGWKSRTRCFGWKTEEDSGTISTGKKPNEEGYQKKTTGQSRVAAMFMAAWKSPSEAAPSPK